jgi:AcrR family transcriptional regulator
MRGGAPTQTRNWHASSGSPRPFPVRLDPIYGASASPGGALSLSRAVCAQPRNWAERPGVSEAQTTVAEELGELETLPRGNHGIAPELIVDNQRRRLLSATAEGFVEEGYARLSVASIIGRAHVSRRTFYTLFDDKLDCVLATHLLAFQQLEKALRTSCASRESWPQSVASAVRAALDFAAGSPEQASLLAFAPLAAQPELTARALAAKDHLLVLLRRARGRHAEAEAPGEMVEQALLMGVMQVVGSELAVGRAQRLPALAPELAQILLTPYLGEGVAMRVASAAV